MDPNGPGPFCAFFDPWTVKLPTGGYSGVAALDLTSKWHSKLACLLD